MTVEVRRLRFTKWQVTDMGTCLSTVTGWGFMEEFYRAALWLCLEKMVLILQ